MTDDRDTLADRRTMGFFMVDNAIIDRMDLDPFTLALYVVICRHANMSAGVAFPSLETLSRKAKMSKKSVKNHIDKLVNVHKLIAVTPRKRENGSDATNCYTLTDPPNDKTPVGGEGVSEGGGRGYLLPPPKNTTLEIRDAKASKKRARAREAVIPETKLGVPKPACLFCGQSFQDAIAHLRSHCTPTPKPARPDLSVCPHCREQVAIATIIDKAGGHTRVCPACKKTLLAPPDPFADKNEKPTPPLFNYPDALSGGEWDVMAYALHDDRRLVRVNEATVSLAERLVERGYLRRTTYRTKYKLTELGETLRDNVPASSKIWQEICRASDKNRGERIKQQLVEGGLTPTLPKGRPVPPDFRPLYNELCARFGGLPGEMTASEHKFRLKVAGELFRSKARPEDVVAVAEFAEAQGWKECSPGICLTWLSKARDWKRAQAQAVEEKRANSTVGVILESDLKF